MFCETSPGYRAVFFPGSAKEPEPVPTVAEVKMPLPAFEAMMTMAHAAYAAGYRMTLAGEVVAPATIEGSV